MSDKSLATAPDDCFGGLAVGEFGFCRERRLRTAADFSSVFGFRRVLRGVIFDLHYRPADTRLGEASHEARLGLVISKRFAKRATQRNLIKRLARETFRLLRSSLPSYDLVLRLAKPSQEIKGFNERLACRVEIEGLFGRLLQ